MFPALEEPVQVLVGLEQDTGGLDSVAVGFRVFGAPRLSVHSSQNPLKQVFWDLWTEIGGTKNAKSNHDGSNHPFLAF